MDDTLKSEIKGGGSPDVMERQIALMKRAVRAAENPSPAVSLRDMAALQALGGICAHGDTWGLMVHEMAAKSYEIADAFLSAREDRSQGQNDAP